MIIQWLRAVQVPAGTGRPLIICDRDGTLTVDTGAPHLPDRLMLNMMTVTELVRIAPLHATLAIVSNQSAIGRGVASLDSVFEFNQELARQLADYGLHVEIAVFCPHQPLESGQPACRCRKPQASMLQACLALFQPSSAMMLGDAESDLEAASRAGIPGLLLKDGNLGAESIRQKLLAT